MSEPKAPWLSVILPTYNGEAHLRDALRSLEANSSNEIEIIAIDDGSTDSTSLILKEFSVKLPLRIIQTSRTGNWVRNTNFAIQGAKGDYLSFLHQDDRWLPNRATTMKELVLQSPDAAMAFTPSYFISASGNRVGKWRCPFKGLIRRISAEELRLSLLIQNFIAIPAPIFKRSCAQAIGGLDETLWFTSDWLFWLQLTKMGDAVLFNEPLVEFRIHEHSQTALKSGTSQNYRQQFERVLSSFASELNSFPHIEEISRYSVEINVRLAEAYRGSSLRLVQLLRQTFRLGLKNFMLYLENSRIVDRVLSRLRARMFG